MSPRGSSERMVFLRREIARIEGRCGEGLAPRAASTRLDGNADISLLLSPDRLAANLHEIVPAAAADAFAAANFALGLCAHYARTRPEAGVILVAEEFVWREIGAPYGPGLFDAGLDPANLVIVRTHHPRETLRVMEEALKCRSVAAAVGESAIDARLYSLDVSRRLTLAARGGGGAGFLTPVRFAGAARSMSSAAETRLEVHRRSSAIEKFGQASLGTPGPPVAGVRLLRARGVPSLDSERVHEVAYDAFSFGCSPVHVDRPDQTSGVRTLRSA